MAQAQVERIARQHEVGAVVQTIEEHLPDHLFDIYRSVVFVEFSQVIENPDQNLSVRPASNKGRALRRQHIVSGALNFVGDLKRADGTTMETYQLKFSCMSSDPLFEAG